MGEQTQNPPADGNEMTKPHPERHPNPPDAATRSSNPDDPRWEGADRIQQDNAEKLGEHLDEDKQDKTGGR